ncbi:hypothetical protein [Aquimarina sp. I32.4]|uniref:hypothetical protein n=1 Tax=Aquimarina sp. I32.4 TaxID=2053903 RepID=UPI000CDE9AA6|nr:hypothetical protein [Aquimarina sp. I32.4]
MMKKIIINTKTLLFIILVIVGINVILYYTEGIGTLKKEAIRIQQESKSNKEFSKQLQYIEDLHDSLQLPNINVLYLQSVIDSKMVMMLQKKNSDAIKNRLFYTEIINTQFKIYDLYKNINKLQEKLIQSEESIEQQYRSIILQLAKKHQRD